MTKLDRIVVIKMLRQRDKLALKIKNRISKIKDKKDKEYLKYLAKSLY